MVEKQELNEKKKLKITKIIKNKKKKTVKGKKCDQLVILYGSSHLA